MFAPFYFLSPYLFPSFSNCSCNLVPLIHAHFPFSLFFSLPPRVTQCCPLDHCLREKVKLLTWSPDFVIYWLGRRSLCVSNGRKDVSINIRDKRSFCVVWEMYRSLIILSWSRQGWLRLRFICVIASTSPPINLVVKIVPPWRR